MHMASVVSLYLASFSGAFYIGFLFIIWACLLFLALDNGEILCICLIL
jgi:hypothetical protein